MINFYVKSNYTYKTALMTFFYVFSLIFLVSLPVNIFMYIFIVAINIIFLTFLNKMLFKKKIKSYIYLSFFYLICFGLLYAYNAYKGYGNFFGTVSDDSFYFYRSMDIMNGIEIGISSLFEYVSALLLKLISTFISLDELSVIYLLPFSYTLISLGIESMNHLYNIYHNKPLPFKYYVIFIVLNQNIVSNCIPFYRESYAIFLFLLGLYYIEINLKTNLFITTILLFNIRGAFALLLISYFLLRKIYKEKYKSIYIFIFILIFFLVYALFDYIAPYLSFSGANNFSVDLLDNRLSLRTEGMSSSVALLYSNPILRIFYFLIVPNNIIELHGIYDVVQHVSTWNSVSYVIEMTNWLAILNWVTVIILPYTIPRVLFGMINMVKNKDQNVSSFGIFVIYSWILIAVFSMQVRHFAILIILFPIFFGYWNKTKTKFLNQICNILTLSLYLVIFILNIL